MHHNQFLSTYYIASKMNFSTILVSLALLSNGVTALVPTKVSTAKKPAFSAQKIAFNGIAAASLASALVV